MEEKSRATILEDCARIDMPVENYLQINNYCSEVEALPARGGFYNMAYAEMDMFSVDESIADKYNLAFLKKIKMVPLFTTQDGILLVAIGKPVDYNSVSMAATFYTGQIEFILVPPTQIDILLGKAEITVHILLHGFHDDGNR